MPTLIDHEQSIANLQALLKTREAEIEDLAITVQERDAALRDMENKWDLMEGKISELEDLVQSRDATIVERDRTIADLLSHP